MSDDMVNIEVDGRPLKAQKGQMVMQVTDVAGIYVPRFCYHEKLSIAANCRMCLVEIEKAPTPMPACATPVAEGMKVFTRSPRAIAAQKATMEFLLINHPLDCPICDQGGECELQDLALGFGSASSRFDERKRVVKDKDLGPLISTDMTRCIHCTRCVRFTAEIAGLQELGATGRGEDMEIGTWIERSVDHELSGNVIDLCPVGALNSKPFRHRARSWEMTEHELVSPHDATGTNLYGHVLRGRLMRVVPRRNDDINETWIADRDRFSCEGIYSADRLQAPMMRVEGRLREVAWDVALAAAADILKAAAPGGAGRVGFLGSPGATTEELFLLGRLARGMGSHNVDTRLRQQDFRDQDQDPAYPGIGCALRDIESLESLLLVGCHVREEAPLVAHWVRKAALRGARVDFLTTVAQECHFPVGHQIVVQAAELAGEFAGLLQAAVVRGGQSAPAPIATLIGKTVAPDAQRQIVDALASGRAAIILGGIAMRHTRFADLRAAAAALASLTGATLGYLPDGGNAAGAALAGALPHRLPGGRPDPQPGLHVRQMLESPLAACLMFGGIEPECDLGSGSATVLTCPQLIAITPFASASLLGCAQVLLPMGTFAETSGTYVNAEGRWQETRGCAQPVGDARPGWKILRVLGNLLDLDGFDYGSSTDVLEELRGQIGKVDFDGKFTSQRAIDLGRGGTTSEVAIYQADAIVRRATPLQKTRAGQAAAAAG
ncbi:MAG: NADH-quinone oxidoreductase subunit NuoG [Steroidobacteraceae bacterium]